MKSNKWLGLTTALSTYSSPSGSTVEQRNLQLILPGSAAPRPALNTILNRQDGSFIFGLYRKTNGLAVEDTVFAHMETYSPRQGVLAKTVIEEVRDDSNTLQEIRTLQGIYTFDEQLDMGLYPSFCEDRHGNTYVFYGHGVRPLVIESDAETVVRIGLDAPTVEPSVTPSGSGFFIERIDVLDGGGSYWAAPTISIDSPGGTYQRIAKGRAIVENGLVVAVEMLDYGTGYTRAPSVSAVAGKKGRGFSARCNVQTTPQTFGHTRFNFFDPSSGTSITPTVNDPTEVLTPSWAPNRNYRLIGDGSGEVVENVTVAASSEPGATHDLTLTGLKEYMAGDVLQAVFDGNPDTCVVISHRLVGNNSVLAIASSIADGATTSGTIQHQDAGHTHATPQSTQSNAELAIASLQAAAPLDAAYTARTVFNGTFIQAYDSATNTITTSHPLDNGTNTLVVNPATQYGTFAVGQIIEIRDWNDDDNLTTPEVKSVLAYTAETYSAVYGDADGTENFDGEVALTDGTGTGATALLEFDVSEDSFQAVIASQANSLLTGTNSDYYAGGFRNYGLQAHPTRYKWGWQNRINDHRGCDYYFLWVNCYYDGWTYRHYWPDYRYITVWKHTGAYGSYDQTEWTPVAHLVQYDNQTPYVDVELEPSLKENGTAVAPAGTSVKPTVRITLEEAPTTWDRTWTGRWVGGDDMGPSWHREGINTFRYSHVNGSQDAQFWKNKEGNTQRPLVNVTGITFLNKGQGYPSDTRFRIRIAQADASHEHIVGPVGAGATPPRTVTYTQPIMDFDGQHYDVTFDNTEPSGAAVGKTLGDVSETPKLLNPGTGYLQGETSHFHLLQRSKAGTIWKFSRYFEFAVRKLTETLVSDKIGSITILSPGNDYYAPPTLIETPSSGFGLKATAVVNTNGQITSVIIAEQQRGAGYEQGNEPFLITSDVDATFTPVLRPVMQGVYRCAYRFVDTSRTYIGTADLTYTADSEEATVVWAGDAADLVDAVIDHPSIPHMTRIRSARKTDSDTYAVKLSRNPTTSGVGVEVQLRDTTKEPIYSDFSPIVDVDCGPTDSRASTGELVWNIAANEIPERATKVELFRTAGDQSLVFYRLEAYGEIVGGNVVISGTDTLNDEELFDPGRPHYAAVPVVLPNGNLNAYRFGVARGDMALCCAFQDRLWYAGSTSGDSPNTVFFSEYDEFESCPKENEIPIQNNQRVTDYLTALVPYGSVLIVAQANHSYQLSYNTDPAVDAAVTLISNRGCVNNRCWDLYDDVLYALDERGVYAMDRSGKIQELSEAIADVFVDGSIDFTKRDVCHLKIDRKKAVLRVFVPTADAGVAPDIAYCYSLEYGRWWTEDYPFEVTCSVNYKRYDTQNEEPVYGTSDGTVRAFGGETELPYRSIKSITLTPDETGLTGGSGYTSTPKVRFTVGNGIGGEARAIVRDGKVIEIEIVKRGHNYGSIYNNGQAWDEVITVAIDAPQLAGGRRATATATAYYPKFFEQQDASLGLTPDQSHLTVGWSLKTPNLELASDATVKNGEAEIDRSISVTYEPTPSSSVIVLRHFYNNSEDPRQNVMPRDRGTGFKHIADSTRTELDMALERVPLGHATGIATARFAGRSYSDLAGVDRHLAIEFSQLSEEVTAGTTQPTAKLYSYEVNGVIQRDE